MPIPKSVLRRGERQERTEWHRIVLWRRLAELVGQYLKKGSKVYVEGKLQTRTWDDAKGQKHYATEIIAQTLEMLDSQSGGPADLDMSYGGGANDNTVSRSADRFTTEEDLPF